jgi:predicted RNA-binding protein with PUA-like domain
MNYWLMKSEPLSYSIDDLRKEKRSYWEGVRNYQARNYMKDSMKTGDLALFYHSNAKPSGVAGICRITKTHIPDHTSWDPESQYYDPKSSKDSPRWIMVEVEFVKKFQKVIPLTELRQYSELKAMKLLQKGSRLSILPVKESEFNFILSLSE